MSDHSEPYANGFGILAGILILWVGTFALFFAAKALFYGAPGEGGEDGLDEDEESRAAAQRIDVASFQSREVYKAFLSSDVIPQTDLSRLQRR